MSYSSLKTPHTISKMESDGQKLLLEDGSCWEIYEGFTFRTSAWSEGEMVTVKNGKNPEYPYTLINIHKNEQVEARFHEDK